MWFQATSVICRDFIRQQASSLMPLPSDFWPEEATQPGGHTGFMGDVVFPKSLRRWQRMQSVHRLNYTRCTSGQNARTSLVFLRVISRRHQRERAPPGPLETWLRIARRNRCWRWYVLIFNFGPHIYEVMTDCFLFRDMGMSSSLCKSIAWV